MGENTLLEYMSRFGFNQTPPIDLPSDQVYRSGIFDTSSGRFLGPNDPIDIARVAIGQERLAVTPFQMATVAATIANGGERMRPQLVDRVITPGGGTLFSNHPQSLGQALSRQTAQDLGYHDQAHFIRDFRAQVGFTPAAYARRCAAHFIRTPDG